VSATSSPVEPVSPAEHGPSAPAPQVDQNLIDDLVGRADRKAGPPKE